MFRAGNDRLLHVAVFDSDNPSDTLALLDESCAAMESAMRHAHLLAAIKDDGHAVTFCIVVHDTSDVESASVVLSSS